MSPKKQVFIDRERSVVIKVFPTPIHLQRELAGIRAFRKVVEVPNVEILDLRVAKITLISGFLAYQIPDQELIIFIANLLNSLKPINPSGRFSILHEIKRLEVFFTEDQEAPRFLSKLRKLLVGQPLFPVHGDMQKQNILISDGQLSLIDFEHFIEAPRELELVNSLFFSDGNCLDIESLSSLLNAKSYNKKLLRSMLQFYALKQRSFGMSMKESSLRLVQALTRTNKLTFGKELKQTLLPKGGDKEWRDYQIYL